MRRLIVNAFILQGNDFQKGNILMDETKIIRVGDFGQVPADEVIDAHGLYAAPGLIDLHVHLRDFDQSAKETVLTGTAAAAAGGFCGVVAMANTSPPVDCLEMIEKMLNKASAAPVHVYPVAAVTKGMQGKELTDFETLRRAGAVAFSEDGRPVENTKLYAQAMQKADELHMMLLDHCEDLYLTDGGLLNEGSVSSQLRVKGVPAAAEEAAVARDIALAAYYGAAVHLCHVSTARSVAAVRQAKRAGIRVSCETAPHYFAFTHEELLRQDADYRMSPPLRTQEDREAIIEGLKDGTIDAIATDHAPHTAQEKADFSKAPNGVVGLETALAAGITWLVRPGHLTLAQLMECMSETPRKLLGLGDGALCEGNAADLFLFDPQQSWKVEPEKLHSRSKNTPFKGLTLWGRVKQTICGGKTVYQDKFI